MKDVSLVLGAGLLLSVAGFAGSLYFLFAHGWHQTGDLSDKLYFEVFKLCMTTMLVGGVAIVFDFYRKREERRGQALKADEQARQAELARHEEIRTHQRARLEIFLDDFIHTYNEIKKIRRSLQHAVVEKDGVLVIDEHRYTTLMEKLNDSQLEVEKFKRILKSKPPYLEKIASKGTKQLTSAERYLRLVTREIEENALANHEDKIHLVVDPESRFFEFAIAKPTFDKTDEKGRQLLKPITDFFDALNNEIKREQISR